MSSIINSCARTTQLKNFKINQTKPNKKMTRNQFNSLCAIRYIDPSLALENESIIEALQNGGDVQEIEEILENEF